MVMMKKVGIIMGSDSDMEIMAQAAKDLADFGISYDRCVQLSCVQPLPTRSQPGHSSSAAASVHRRKHSADSKKFDISKIDFDRLRKEFEKAPRKNLLMMDLQQLIEQRLAQMLKENPLRIDYYERYQAIVNEYNQDNKKDTIAVTFENLMKLVSELDDEQKRYIAEGFDSDEELSIYDLLISGQTLSKEDIKKVKKLAQEMLTKIKARIHELDHWRDKEETQSIISVLKISSLYPNLIIRVRNHF